MEGIEVLTSPTVEPSAEDQTALGLDLDLEMANAGCIAPRAVTRIRKGLKSADSIAPARCATAPVKAPRVCPNSSLSRRFPGSAAQSTMMNGRCARLDRRWLFLWIPHGDGGRVLLRSQPQ